MPKGYSAHAQRAGKTFAERLAYRSRRAPNGCLLWHGAKLQAGYGVLAVEGVRKLAHRAAWEEAHGAIPKGMQVCHHCDTPNCIEPEHLFLGTQADNMADKRRKRRHSFGEKHYRARFTEAQAREIATSDVPAAALAKRFGVRPHHITRIRTGERWSHLQEAA